MNKPNNYDTTKAGGTFAPVILGGHRAIIKNVSETTSKTGREMITVSIDFASEDSQSGYFGDLYKEDTREPKKWPYNATQYILCEDSEGNTSRSFKSFCTSFENSNNCEIKWGIQNWGAQFNGKRIGVVFGEVEEEYNGQIKTRHRIRWFYDDHKALEQTVPEKKYLANGSSGTGSASSEPLDIFLDADDTPFR